MDSPKEVDLDSTTEELEEELYKVSCPNSLNSGDLVQHLQCCIIDQLKRKCSRTLAGSWSNSDNFVVEHFSNCGLSNYLFYAQLNDDVPTEFGEPRKVFIRVYGEVLRSSVDSIVFDSISFALLSEKGIGPKLYGIFPGGRIEEFIESRPLLTNELRIPALSKVVARNLARLHNLNMPFPKKPTFIYKSMERYLRLLTSVSDRPRRPPTNSTTSLLQTSNLNDAVHGLDGPSTDQGPSDKVIDSKVYEFKLLEEYQWLKTRMMVDMKEFFPVVFCHNDLQENNILLLNNPKHDGLYEIMMIDFEYCSYNYRAFDIGNYFNEWCIDCTYSEYPYFTYNPENYPNQEEQSVFWNAYLSTMDEISAQNEMRTSSGGGGRAANLQIQQVTISEKLRLEAIYGSLMSNLIATAWALIQSQVSSIRFGFVEYAEARMDFYRKMKSWLPPDHLNGTITITTSSQDR